MTASGNRVAVAVTGGSAGIGAEICRTFLDEGCDVVILDRAPPVRSHERQHHIAVDLMDLPATRAAAADIARRFDVTRFVHNAGVIRPALVEAARAEDIAKLADLHLGSALVLLQAFLPAMKARGDARVVLMSSRAALGVATRTAYSATKAAMIGMGRTWALELAQHGITVNMVAPGPIGSTQMFEALVPPASDVEAKVVASIPVKRLGRPSDVANAVRFFASPHSGFVTGQTLYVCGGASIGTAPL